MKQVQDETPIIEQPQWVHKDNPQIRALLDHIAEELAREYIELMESSVASTITEEDSNEESGDLRQVQLGEPETGEY